VTPRADATPPPERLRLSASEADVFVLNPEAPDAFDFGRAWSMLSDEERARTSRFRRETDGRTFVAAHALLRATLARYTGCEPLALKFSEGSFGRPELAAGMPPLSFSLSHTEGLVGCAVSRAEIGFDLEIARRPAPLEIAGRYFSTAEQDALSAAATDARDERFYALWTLKEAVLKALGFGLSLPLDSISIMFESGGSPRLEAAPGSGVAATDWSLRSWRQGACLAGLAVRRHVQDVRIHIARL
jgi:4'-phosphopantetheinyl transferase